MKKDAACAAWGLTLSGQAITGNGGATVWPVIGADGSRLALKIYDRGHAGNETWSAWALRAFGTEAAVEVIAEDADQGWMLLRWLDGPSLGDLVRNGQDTQATDLLGQVARRILDKRVAPPAGMPHIETWLEALRQLPLAGRERELAQNLAHAQELCARLLETRPDSVCVLHGDLHHDNVILTAGIPKAFDAKGVVGEPAYELANAFRNPKGAGDILTDPEVYRARRALWAQAARVSEDRLAHWAAVKCALSISWRLQNSARSTDQDAGLLSFLLRNLPQTAP